VDPEELLRTLRCHSDAKERERAARLLDHAPQTEAIEIALITAARSDTDPMVRKWSLHALGCATCKPDGTCSAQVVDLFVEALLHDRNAKVRRFAAGMMMHGQLGRDDRVTDAFRKVSQHSQRILRERAEHYLARLAS
jgi:hypothetical protein